jgi:preprotein translocase subunit SecY
MSLDIEGKLRNNFVVYLMLVMLFVIMFSTFYVAYEATDSYRELVTGFKTIPASVEQTAHT